MPEYIDKDALIKQAEKSWLYFGVLSVIQEVPAVDVAPVVHGRWETHLLPLAWKCSVCGFKNSFRPGRTTEYLHYCPHCGAKMDLEELQ